MPQNVRKNNSPHFQFDKDVVCKAFSDILSRQHNCEVIFTLVEKEESKEDSQSVSHE